MENIKKKGKILFVNAPFITYNGEFLNIEKKIKQEKLYKTLDYIFNYPVEGKIRNIIDKICRYNVGEQKEGFRYGVRAGSRWPWTSEKPHGDSPYPFIMGYSAALLESKGYEVNIIDAVVMEMYDYRKFIKEVKKEKAQIVVIECAQITQSIDLWVAKEVSKFAEVALAGVHFTDEIIEEIKKNHPYIKYYLKGEYIKSALKMAKTKKEGIYESEIVTELDSIPFPYRKHKDANKYYEITMPTKKPQLQIYGSKGCPFKCSFCLWPQTMYRGNVSLRSPKKIYEEIKINVEKYGYKSIFFDDDTFNIGEKRVSELCEYLKEIGLPWTMMGRLDCSPMWLYDKMANSGCVGMRFGVETFNIEVLKKINKGLERFDFLNTLKTISKEYPEIWLHITMMKDLPGQSEAIHQNDLKILKDLGFTLMGGKRSYQLATCVPYKGTRLYNEIIEKIGIERYNKEAKYDGNKETIMSKLNKEKIWGS